jgi:hypothetical protein
MTSPDDAHYAQTDSSQCTQSEFDSAFADGTAEDLTLFRASEVLMNRAVDVGVLGVPDCLRTRGITKSLFLIIIAIIACISL